MKHIFDVYNTHVDEDLIAIYAKNYIKLLTDLPVDIESIDSNPLFQDTGFSSKTVTEIIKKNSIPSRKITSVPNDIFRSDFGEMLLVSFFEKSLNKKYPEQPNFIIPLKNITNRENVDKTARGFDVVGYRLSDKLGLLLGESKVSDEKRNPPRVVDSADDSIYTVHTLHRTDKQYLHKKLTTLAKRLPPDHATYILLILSYLDTQQYDKVNIVYGCCLIRDSACFMDSDFGKMKINSSEFDPNCVHFIIPCLDMSIKETIDAFHAKVVELTS